MSLDAGLPLPHDCSMIYPALIQMTHIDPTQNMARFYEISIQPTLFGEASVLRSWGRIGARGQSMMVTYAQQDDAAKAMIRLQQQKQRRGYM